MTPEIRRLLEDLVALNTPGQPVLGRWTPDGRYSHGGFQELQERAREILERDGISTECVFPDCGVE